MPDAKRIRIEAENAERRAVTDEPRGASQRRPRTPAASSRVSPGERTRAPKGRGGGKSSRRRSGSHSNAS